MKPNPPVPQPQTPIKKPPSKLLFPLALLSWLLTDILGLKFSRNHKTYYQYNRGIGTSLFATICTILASQTYNPISPVDGYQDNVVAMSMVLWPGWLWGMVGYALLEGAEGRRECVWLVMGPLCVVLLGRAALGRMLGGKVEWRVEIGLIWMGIVMGHFLGQSDLGHGIEEFISGVLGPTITSIPRVLVLLGGVATMFLSLARITHSHSLAIKEPEMVKKIPQEAIIPFRFPPFWGVSGSLYVTTWTIGLALCVGSLEYAQARAILGSMSIAIILPMAFLPPFSGRIWGWRYEEFMRGLLVLHIGTVSLVCLYHVLVEGIVGSV